MVLLAKQYRGGDYENVTESSGAVSFILAIVCARCDQRYSDRPIGRTIRDWGRETNSRGVGAIGRANGALSRRVGFTDTRRGNVPAQNCSGRSWGPGPSEPHEK